MGRDRKASITQDASKVVFPVSRRSSITSSFSLPSLSLSSRSKTTPVLVPLDTSRANIHPLDSGGTTSSSITPSVSHPQALELAPSPSRSVSPGKPPASPGASIPLPSIRSLRSRFSFTTQDPPNLPGIALQTPSQKRVTSRRFLPFGNSGSSNQPSNSTPSVPRKSLSDVFALGRASTSSRYDSTSSRSVTPSSKSTRSVTSVGTMRGPWSHGSGYSALAPPLPATSPRPRSHDFTLDAELGYVIAIESGDDTIRCRPDLPPAEPPPRLRDSSQTIIESSRENLSQMTLSPPAEIPSPTLPEFVPSSLPSAAGFGAPISNLPNLPGNVARRRQSPVPPIAIPPPGVPIELDGVDSTEKTAATVIDSEGEGYDALPAAFPFTPIDDRSDVTSSANNTPHSGDQSRAPPNIPPPLPSPSPRPGTNTRDGFPFLKTLPPSVDSILGPTGDTSTRGSQVEPPSASSINSISSGTVRGYRKSSAPGASLYSHPAEPQSGGLDPTAKAILSFATASSEYSPKPSNSVLGLVAEQSGPPSHSIPKVEVSSNSAISIDSDPHRIQLDRHSYLLSTLSTPTSNGAHSATPSGQDSGFSDMSGTASRNTLAQGSTLGGNQSGGLVSLSTQLANSPVKDPSQGGRYLNTIEEDLARLLSPHRFSPTDKPNFEQRQLRTPASAHVPLPSTSLTPQPSPLQRAGTRLPLPESTPSPSALSTRVSDLLSAKSSVNNQHGGPTERNAVSLNGSPMLSPGKLSSSGSWGAEQTSYRDVMTTPNNPTRLLPRRSPSVGAVITRKRSASFDSSGSPTLTRDMSDPFGPHSIGPKRTDWLGPRTAKAFAAAGLIDKERDKSSLYSGPRSDTPSHRGGALNSWRTHGERNGGFGPGAGSVRSHSRLGSEIISPSFRTRSLAGGDSSPGYRRSSLDHTAPPSPVSTHRTLVSSATSSSQSQSALQNMRERHELETEALLLALAGSKRTERDLRVENDELMAYIVQLERRVAILEMEKEQTERSQSRAKEYRWNTPSPSDVETLDKRRQEILAGRPSARGWNGSNNKSSVSSGRSPLYGRSPLPAGLPRAASAASVYRNTSGAEFDKVSPSKPLDIADTRSLTRRSPTVASASTPTSGNVNHSLAEVSTPTRDYFDDWSEPSFSQPLQSSPRLEARNRLSSNSVTSLVPQMPGNMSMLVHEQPGGEFAEDEISFGSASPSSMTLAHPRNNTPKPTPANISPVTADFSFNSIPGSPRSLRLGPEEEMHLADLISLQGLEITDVIGDLDL
ncbi:unnamed protein product [Rhizoctonia solani]|uniref:Uncharacterized protein n=1 Tax=Rhizoctonia solani TaxID=456999 RepID=A0A8H3DMM1_9AGAM|nr:unnamed protein product [Rhizoctonia solani]